MKNIILFILVLNSEIFMYNDNKIYMNFIYRVK